MRALFVLCLAGVAFGLWLALDGLRAQPTKAPRIHVDLPADARLRILRAVVGALVLWVVTRWAVGAIAGAALGWWLTELVAGGSVREREIARTEAIATWTEMLRDTLSGAHGLEETITTSADVAPQPIRAEVIALASALEHESLRTALRRFADDLAHPTGDLVVAALSLAASGSTKNLGDLLSTLAKAARDECGMRLRVEAARARMRTAVRVITTCTLLTAVGLVVFNRSYLAIYGDALGQCVLGLIAVSWAVSLRWLSKMGRFVTPERFLLHNNEEVPA